MVSRVAPQTRWKTRPTRLQRVILFFCGFQAERSSSKSFFENICQMVLCALTCFGLLGGIGTLLEGGTPPVWFPNSTLWSLFCITLALGVAPVWWKSLRKWTTPLQADGVSDKGFHLKAVASYGVWNPRVGIKSKRSDFWRKQKEISLNNEDKKILLVHQRVFATLLGFS